MSETVKERIGFDLDSVICDIDTVMEDTLKNKFNLYLDWENDFICYDFMRNPNLTKYIAKHLMDIITDGSLFMNSLPYSDVYDGLKLIRESGLGVDIVTSRYKDKEDLTKEWLANYKIDYDNIYFSKARHKKDIIYDFSLKSFVDDRFDILNMILEKCGQLPYGLIIMDHPWNKKFYNVNVDRVYSFLEACEIITDKRQLYNQLYR